MLALKKQHFVSLLALVFAFVGIAFVQAWTGPAAAPPNNNVDAPLNVGTVDQIKNAALGLDALAVFGNAIISTTDGYLNFGSTAGTNGYGFRDNAGTMEFKDDGGLWTSFASAGGGESGGTGGNGGDYQVFTSSGTWTKPAGTGDNQLIVVEMWGGGGGNKGGGGAYNRLVLRAADIGATESVTVAGGGASGSPGGTSSFGSHGSAYGGGPGSSSYAGGGGGIASTGGAAGHGGLGGAANGAGGNPHGGAGSGNDIHSTLGGGAGGSGNSGWGGGGGNGGDSLYGGGGGNGGTSVYGGNAGVAPGGGGNSGAAGARGEVRLWTVPASGNGGGVSAITTATCNMSGGNSCTASCPGGYFRTGCYGTPSQNIDITPASNGCTCTYGGIGSTCYAYCAQ